MDKLFTAIGLMSGTSCDGVDASIIQSDGEDQLKIIENLYITYNDKTREDIRNVKDKIHSSSDIIKNKEQLLKLEKEITILQVRAVEEIINKSKLKKEQIDLIGFHGQTIYHSYREKISKQLGDGNLMNKLTKIKVVNNFREKDIQLGGQGAPLSPIYHKLLCKKLNLDYPILFINIGGISNITFIENYEIVKSFDCGPGNSLIDQFLQIKSNNKIRYDKDGEKAFQNHNLSGYNKIRMYGFLAERFMPFWFIKNYNITTCPITFFDNKSNKKF